MQDDQVLSSIIAGIERFGLAARELGRQGWTVPMHLTPREVYRLLVNGSPRETDAAFVQLYEEEEGAFLGSVAAGLLARPTLAPWHQLLFETVDAIRRQHFVITVPALLTVFEGAIMRGEPSTKVKSTVRSQVSKYAGAGPGSVTLLVWQSVEVFVDEVFKGAPFDKSRPNLVNRHWILHGRDETAWTQADAIRLLQAVDTVTSLQSWPRSNESLQPTSGR